jgi:hypothetical protein
MQARNAVELWAKSGLVWLLFGMGFGIYLGMTEQFGLSAPHAHAGLLGGVWAIAFSYLFSRQDGGRRMGHALWQWVAYNAGVAAFVIGFWLVMKGNPGVAPLGVAGAFTIGLSALWIIITLWPGLKARGDG